VLSIVFSMIKGQSCWKGEDVVEWSVLRLEPGNLRLYVVMKLHTHITPMGDLATSEGNAGIRRRNRKV
jgi:hypothetical protein